MAGIAVLITYLAAGVICVRALLPRYSPLVRWWIGGCAGILLLMWLPTLAAYFVRYTLTAEIIALTLLLALSGFAVFWQKKHPVPLSGFDKSERTTALAILCCALPLTLLSAYLQYTHTLREVDGALHVGQSTYGDLCMHLSIATSLRNSALPADYNFLPGTTLGYPLLTDATATSMLLFGMPVSLSLILPGTIMSALVYSGYILLAREMGGGKVRVAVLAFILLFFNGGLGFLYDFDMSGNNYCEITDIFTGYYTTPANQPEYNLRWSNIVVDALLPQRTLLGGWCILLPTLYLVRKAFTTKDRKLFILAGIWGGAMPMVHTHSFLDLALYSLGMGLYCLVAQKESRRELLRGAVLYLGIAAVLSLPQLYATTLQQVSGGGFLRFHFNWVNYSNQSGFIDFYPWFWIKNVGLPLFAIIAALFDAKHEHIGDAFGAFLIFLIAETVLFQPLDYDNNKLFYVWYLLMLPMAADWLDSLYEKMHGMRARALLASVFILCSTLSGSLSIAREVISDYELFSSEDVALAKYIDANTEPDDVFIIGMNHNSPVYTLCGRDVVCGPSLFLVFHGLDYYEQSNDVRTFYADPANSAYILEKYNVSYIVVDIWARSETYVDEDTIAALYPLAFECGTTRLYSVKDTTN